MSHQPMKRDDPSFLWLVWFAMSRLLVVFLVIGACAAPPIAFGMLLGHHAWAIPGVVVLDLLAISVMVALGARYSDWFGEA